MPNKNSHFHTILHTYGQFIVANYQMCLSLYYGSSQTKKEPMQSKVGHSVEQKHLVTTSYQLTCTLKLTIGMLLHGSTHLWLIRGWLHYLIYCSSFVRERVPWAELQRLWVGWLYLVEVQEVKADLLIKYNEYQRMNCPKNKYGTVKK